MAGTDLIVTLIDWIRTTFSAASRQNTRRATTKLYTVAYMVNTKQFRQSCFHGDPLYIFQGKKYSNFKVLLNIFLTYLIFRLLLCNRLHHPRILAERA
jgi:hypothetical protein